jgi:GNAT superfamily N-acetyltransferase
VESLLEFNLAIALETEGRKLNQDTLRCGLQAVLNDPALGFYCVAECDDQVVGSLMVTTEWSDWRNGVFWWIQSVYVVPDYRGRGIFRSLYEHIQTLALDHNVCGFRLYVERDNNIAQSTYEKLGMHQTVYQMFEQPWPPTKS